MKNVKLFIIVFWLIFSGFISLIAEDYPIIFVHGSNNKGSNGKGWSTWNHSSSAMMRILNEQYGGYEWGITSEPLYGQEKEIIQDTLKKEMRDTLKQEKKFKKMNFGIGYSSGICVSGRNLKASSDFIGTPFEWLYRLNYIEGNFIWPLNEKKRIEGGVGYNWIKLKNRNGWRRYFEPSDTTYMQGAVGGGVNVVIKRICIFLGNRMRNRFVGVEVGYTSLKTKEILSYYRPTENWKTIDESIVIRHCIGGGIYINHEIKNSINPHFFIILGGRISYDFEILNNSPFKWTKVEKKVGINFSGLYIGIKLTI
jgi:hypothetical protein